MQPCPPKESEDEPIYYKKNDMLAQGHVAGVIATSVTLLAPQGPTAAQNMVTELGTS